MTQLCRCSPCCALRPCLTALWRPAAGPSWRPDPPTLRGVICVHKGAPAGGGAGWTSWRRGSRGWSGATWSASPAGRATRRNRRSGLGRTRSTGRCCRRASATRSRDQRSEVAPEGERSQKFLSANAPQTWRQFTSRCWTTMCSRWCGAPRPSPSQTGSSAFTSTVLKVVGGRRIQIPRHCGFAKRVYRC